MSDDLHALEAWAGALLAKLQLSQRRAINHKVAIDLRRGQAQRIKAQQGAGRHCLPGARAAQGVQGKERAHQTAESGDVRQDSYRQAPESEGERRPDRGRLFWLGGARGACASVWPERPHC